jgi:23S rRNA (guanosine2251-2'-O)-methyltransferase
MNKNNAKKLVIIAHNIRSAQNVGAFFRIADCLGGAKIYLTGYTPRPYLEDEDSYMNQGQKYLAKTALGAEKMVAWEKIQSISELIKRLKKDKFKIIGLELDKNANDIKKFKPCFPCALILGSEVEGIDRKILKKCDKIIYIPMKGKKESLNVSVAAGIAVWEILK